MGVAGAATATLVARVISALVMLMLLLKKENPLCIATKGCMKPQWEVITKILKIGIPSGVENGMFQVGKLLVSSLTATFRTAAIAANAVANSIAGFINIPGIAIGLAMVTVIGRCIGAREKAQARYYSKRLMGFAYLGMLLTNVALVAGVRPLVSCFALSGEAKEIAVELLDQLCCLRGADLAAQLYAAERAARCGRREVYDGGQRAFHVGVPRGEQLLFCGHAGLGVLGVWVAMYVDWVFRSLFFAVRYKRGRWMEKRVV